MVHDLMLVRVKTPEESKYPWDYFTILAHISGQDAFGPPDAACALSVEQ
jgi:branched-chain amino acid transport system substrate-binding protein